MLRLPRGLAASVFRAEFSRACSVVAMATGGESAGVSASDHRKNEGPPPLVVILGSTGVGKTKLSIELARRFDGEIISADSMQVYRGLDIVTAKATREEQAQARHHLLDVATPDQAFTVIHFREAALPIIDRLLEQNRMPIVVGGTNYYIESVLWQVLVGTGIHEERTRRRTTSSSSSQEEDAKRPKLSSSLEESESGGNRESAKEDDAKKVVGSENESGEQVVKIAASGDDAGEEESELVARVLPMATEQLEQLESPVLHRVLRRVDPVSADRLHPNNKRKIVSLSLNAPTSNLTSSEQHSLELRVAKLESLTTTLLQNQKSLQDQLAILKQSGVTSGDKVHPLDPCQSANSSGIVHLRELRKEAYCEMDFLEGGWIVFQQQVSSALSFNLNWAQYRLGFGTVGKDENYWLGLEPVHQITNSGDYELAVEFTFGGNKGFARYSQFKLAGEVDKYRLLIGGYSGTLADGLGNRNYAKFSTYDSDNENYKENCASYWSSGWWFDTCSGESALNYKTPYWSPMGYGTFSRMMMRRKK